MGDSAVTLVGFRSDHAGEALSIEGGELYAEGLHLQGNGVGLIATGLSGGDITGGDVLANYGDGLSLEGEKLTLSNLRLIDNLGTGLALQGSIQASNIDSLGNQTGASLEGASLVNAILAWNAGAGVSGQSSLCATRTAGATVE